MTTLQIDNNDIERILQQYKKKLDYDRDRYHNKLKTNPTFIEKNRSRARDYYHKNPNKKKEYYEMNKETITKKNKINYYVKQNKLDVLEKRYPELYKYGLDTNMFTTYPTTDISS